jgi:protease-4
MQSQTKGLIIALGSLVVVGILAIFMFFTALKNMGGAQTSGLPIRDYATIDVLTIQGEIGNTSGSSFSAPVYDHRFILRTLDELIANPNSKGLVLFINSPGGAIYETDEVYLKLLEYKQSGRPIYASLGSMAASGGYYLASAADAIVANRNTLTGSIGVIMSSVLDVSGFLEKHGIKVQSLTAGENKGMGSIYEPMTEEQLLIYQNILNEAHEQFIEVVATGRGMTFEEATAVADGRIFSAKQALAANLVDGLGNLDDTIYWMRENYDLWDSEVYYLEPYYSFSFFDLFLSAENMLKSNSTVEEILSLQERINKIGYYSVSPLLQ